MYKILSLDGGGSWAILQLLTLKERFKDEIPELNGHAILRQFDMVIANSGGSIVLAALAENWTIDKALELFDNKEIRESIFSKNSFKESFFPIPLTRLISFGPKYSSKRKGETFKRLFSSIDKMTMDKLPKYIGKSSLKLIVCTYDALNNRAKFFRSYSLGDNSKEFARLTQAIHGSSNAPIQYFDFPARFKATGSDVFYELWDGALGGFNNPVAAGIIEAFKAGVLLNDMFVISLGNGNKLMSIEQKNRFYQVRSITTKERKKKWKIWKYKFQLEYFKETVMNQAQTILYQPPDWANYVGMMFLSTSNKKGLEDRYLRLSPMIHVDKNTDDTSKELLDQLYLLDMDLTESEEIELLKECFEKWVKGDIWNQPIEFSVTRDNELKYHTGEKYFHDSMNKWKKCNSIN